MKSLKQAILESLQDSNINEGYLKNIESVNTEYINSFLVYNAPKIDSASASKLLYELKKIDNKNVKDCVTFIDILSLPKDDIEKYTYLSGIKKNEQLMQKIGTSIDYVKYKIYDSWCIEILDLLANFYFYKAVDNKPTHEMSLKDCFDGIFIYYKKWFVNAAELNWKNKTDQNITKWFDKCKDFSISGDFRYTKIVKSHNDFNGLISDCEKHIKPNMLSNTELVKFNFYYAISHNNIDEAKDILTKYDYVFEPYVVSYSKDFISYIICLYGTCVLFNYFKNKLKFKYFNSMSGKTLLKLL